MFQWNGTLSNKSTRYALTRFSISKSPAELDCYFRNCRVCESVQVTVVMWWRQLKVTHLYHGHAKMEQMGVGNFSRHTVCIRVDEYGRMRNINQAPCPCMLHLTKAPLVCSGCCVLSCHGRGCNHSVRWWLLSVLDESLYTIYSSQLAVS